MIGPVLLRGLAIVAVCSTLLQEPAVDVKQVLQQLAHEDPQVRAKAETTLLGMGSKAVPELRLAGESKDVRLRESAKRILAEIERVEFEKTRDAENRKVDLELDKRTTNEQSKEYPFVMEGGRCKAAVYTDKGGLAVHSRFYANYRTQFDFDIISISDAWGKALEMQRCDECSPEWAHVAHAGPVRVKYAGTRRWFSDYDVKFENPKDGDCKRIGDFTITVRWPELEVTSTRPYTASAFRGYASLGFDFEFKDPNRTTGVVGTGRFGGRFAKGKEKTTWCTCEGGPKPVQKRDLKNVVSRRIRYSYADVKGVVIPDKVDDVSVIRLTFSKPIEEPFGFESPEIKASLILGER
jgi:hypothetical protein